MNKRTVGKNLPTLASVMRTAGAEVTGERIVGALGHDLSHNYANIRVTKSDGLVRRGQSAGMGTNVTAPGFYTPFTTPSSYQIPNNRREVYLWAQWWFDNEPKVAAGIEFYTDFPLSGFDLDCDNPYVKDYFEDLIKKLNFAKWLPLISQEYHLRGDCFIMMSIECPHCHGLNIDEDTKEACEHEGATWRSVSVLNPDAVEISSSFMDKEPHYFFMPTEEMVKIVMEQKPKDIFDSIHPQMRQQIAARMPIRLDPTCIYHLKRGAPPWQPFGTSIVRRLFPTLAYKDKLRQAQWLVAERHIVPIKIVKVGTPERPANQEDLQSVQEQLTNVANDPLLTLVTHDAFEMDYIGASGKVLQLTNEYELIDQEIIDGLMLNKAIINGDGPSYSNAQVGLVTMAKRLERFRQEVAHWIEEYVFKPVAMWNGFTMTGKRGQEQFIYPTIKWDDLQLKDDTGKLQMMVQAQQAGVISAQTLIESFDLDYDQEVQRLRMEQAANFVSAAGPAGGGMGGGFAGGGGVGPGAGGGAPPMGGGAPPGGAPPPMPGTPPGGAPGMEGGAPGAPGPMASVASEENYRLASVLMNELNEQFTGNFYKELNVRLASKKGFKSAAHEGFVRTMRPVSGRGFDLEALPEELPYNVFPLNIPGPQDGGFWTQPLNYWANVEYQPRAAAVEEVKQNVRLAKAQGNSGGSNAGGAQHKALPPKTLFTKLEQALYNMLTSVNIPYALYAQYQAGPGLQYQLDAAFPALKLGIEADSDTFHNSPDKIAEDRRRDMELASQGWTMLRFTESEINEQQQEVLNVVFSAIRKITNRQHGGDGGSQVQL